MKRRKFFLSIGLAVSATMASFLKPLNPLLLEDGASTEYQKQFVRCFWFNEPINLESFGVVEDGILHYRIWEFEKK